MHLFLDAGNGNILAFFELPNSPEMGRDPNTPQWVQHIAFELEDEDALIVRLYESEERTTRARLRVGYALAEAAETNLMEEEERVLEVVAGEVPIEFRPFEIKTLRLTAARRDRAQLKLLR